MIRNINSFIDRLASQTETAWVNPYLMPYETVKAVSSLVVSDDDINDAKYRLGRFEPFIAKVFPETAPDNGIIESPLREISSMKAELSRTYGADIKGRLFLKMDSHLKVAGSIKARGGIYEVLKHAEDLAVAAGLLRYDDDYTKLASAEMREFFGRYTVQVGSTGNLGMSIGIASAALGFKVKIHMSADAKQWKKDLLRSKGVEVIEYTSDYSKAVAEGRKASDADDMSYFVDDEKSVDLFLGYSVAAGRLDTQLREIGITVDSEHPLIVYLPAGVGGAPGGVGYGLKRLYGDNVHVFFCEPTLYPSLLMGISTQTHEKANVCDIGLGGITEADGLACASPSGFVTRIMTNHLSGDFTVKDGKLYDYLRMLNNSENIEIEPSSCAAFAGVCGLLSYAETAEYCKNHGLDDIRLNNSTQIAWATGGSMVPDEIRKEYLLKVINDK